MIQRQGQGKPTVAVMMLQPQCNMICNFCVTEDNFKSMSFEQAVAMLEHLKSIGVKSLVIGGGEPFDWPHDVLALTQKAKSIGFGTVQIGTNAVALPAGFAQVESVDRYVIPLESFESIAHNQMRKYKNQHHQIIMAVLTELGKAGKGVTISTVVTSFNKDEVLSVGSFLQRYHREYKNVHAWHIYQFLPIGRGGALNAENLAVPETVYIEVTAKAQAMNLPFKVFKRPQMYNSQTVDFFWEA